ncbi:MAG TPA: hypothetical protein VFV99_32640, partial [Kofleriaceae bacterium]|nr:hypothetical protein [Kofleriaceae bacterium]
APQVVQRQLNDPMMPPSQMRAGLSEAVDVVFRKALQPNPKKRWASASTFAVALGRALERMSGEMRVPPTEQDVAALQAESVLGPTKGIDEASGVVPMASIRPEVSGRVRAAHLRVLSKILQHHIGESGIAKMKNERPDLANVLASTLAPLAWVELADLVAALDLTKRTLPNALVARKVGRGTMSATFARLFGADPSSLSPETVMAALPTFWDRYHEWGGVVVGVKPNHVDVTLAGFAGSTEVCLLVSAELERIIELTGAAGVTSTHPRCRCTGNEQCEFTLSWST